MLKSPPLSNSLISSFYLKVVIAGSTLILLLAETTLFENDALIRTGRGRFGLVFLPSPCRRGPYGIRV